MLHFCHAPDCLREIPAGAFFCLGHLRRLPPHLRRPVEAPRALDWRERPGGEWAPPVDAAIQFLDREAKE